MSGPQYPGFDTLSLHAGATPDPATGARATPVYFTSSFAFRDSDHAASLFNMERAGHVYSRISNPTNAVLEERIAALEGGVAGIATASGQAAMHLGLATIAGAGSHIVASRALYGGSQNLLAYTMKRFGIETTFVDPRDLNAWRAAIRPETKALFAETLGNPGLDVLDIPNVAAIAHENHLPLMLDSFFDGEIFEFSNVWQGLLFTISFLLCTIPALTFPFAPPEFKYPHNDFWGKFLFVENWFTPNLANVFGFSSSIWTILPVLISFVFVLFILRRYARRPARFTIGLLVGLIMVGVYLALPNLDNDENRFRRATIAERYFKPANRLEIYKTSTNPQILRRVNDFEWLIADARAFAPDDFPYLPTRDFRPSPGAEIRKVAELQK